MESFAQISQAVFRDYIRSAVIIDDQWPEHESVINDDELDESDLIAEAAEDDEPDVAESGLTGKATRPPRTPRANELDARILGRLRHVLIREGVLTCGLRYQQKDRKTAIELARRADIVVLDWHLVGDDGNEALEILKELQGDSLRFVCIYTGRGRAQEVKTQIESLRSADTKRVEAATGQGWADICLGNLVIAIRVKEGLEDEPDLAVGPDGVLDAAIGGFAKNFGGLIQLAMLEMTQRHREHLPRILEHIGNSIDTAVLLEAGDRDSPVGPGGAFLGVLVDEWRSRLQQDHRRFRVLSQEGRRAFGTEQSKALSRVAPDHLKQHLILTGVAEKAAARFSQKALPEIGRWMAEGCEGNLPIVAGISFKRKNDDRTKNAAWGVLSVVTKREAPLGAGSLSEAHVADPLLRLDAFFHQQFEMPTALVQGTVVSVKRGETVDRLICTTPLCDADQPKKIGGLFTFVRTREAPTENILLGGGVEWYCVIRHGGEYLCLKVLAKERVSLEVWDPSFDEDGIVHACFSIGGGKEQNPKQDGGLELHRVAQLRFEHALALSAASATDAARVGVNRVELIRSRIRRGGS